jgi:hypothetical protein
VASLTLTPWPTVGQVDYTGPEGDVGGGYKWAIAWACDQIDTAHPEGGHWMFLIQPEQGNRNQGMHTRTNRVNHVINFQHNPFDPGTTLIHEVSHGFGLCHPPDVPPGYGCNDPNFPRANDSMGPQVALRAIPAGVGGSTQEMFDIVRGEDSNGAILTFEIMSYHLPSWISLYTYNKGMRGSTGARLVAPAHLEGGG